MDNVTLLQGDCLTLLPTLPSQSVDLICADLPYGTTQAAWDSVIPLDALWQEYRRVLRPGGAVVLTASQPFTSALVMSNPRWFKYDIVWHKSQATGHLNARRAPMREHETILVFCEGQPTYNPQLTRKPIENIRPAPKNRPRSQCYGVFAGNAARTIPLDQTYPRSVVRFHNMNLECGRLHPTQKPLALMEYLLRTYSNPGDCVLDNTMGSGTTGEAAIRLQRAFVGMELRADYYAVACARCAAAQAAYQPALLEVAP